MVTKNSAKNFYNSEEDGFFQDVPVPGTQNLTLLSLSVERQSTGLFDSKS
jgi:hypothetical protein